VSNILMLIGSLTWLIGELWGVRSKKNMDTTSEWVWWIEARIPFTRWLIVTFLLSLIGHFLWHTSLVI
jgi:hypothetical protein